MAIYHCQIQRSALLLYLFLCFYAIAAYDRRPTTTGSRPQYKLPNKVQQNFKFPGSTSPQTKLNRPSRPGGGGWQSNSKGGPSSNNQRSRKKRTKRRRRKRSFRGKGSASSKDTSKSRQSSKKGGGKKSSSKSISMDLLSLTDEPTLAPTINGTVSPSQQPSLPPTSLPTLQPSHPPSLQPSIEPSPRPTFQPSQTPSIQSSQKPTLQPSVQPSVTSSIQPSTQPTPATPLPTVIPTTFPTDICLQNGQVCKFSVDCCSSCCVSLDDTRSECIDQSNVALCLSNAPTGTPTSQPTPATPSLSPSEMPSEFCLPEGEFCFFSDECCGSCCARMGNALACQSDADPDLCTRLSTDPFPPDDTTSSIVTPSEGTFALSEEEESPLPWVPIAEDPDAGGGTSIWVALEKDPDLTEGN